MQDGLRAVHTLFATVVISAVCVLPVCFPRLQDGRRIEALETLERLVTTFDAPAFEASVLAQAETGSAVSLKSLATRIQGPRVENVQAADLSPTLAKASPLGLRTLGDVAAAAAGGQQVTLTGPDTDAAAAAIRWRLARLDAPQDATLTMLEQVPGSVTATQLDTERKVEASRVAVLEARRAANKARGRFTRFRDRAKWLIKHRAARKNQRAAIEKRREAYFEKEEAKINMASSHEAYLKLSAAADGFRAGPERADSPGVVLTASLKSAAGETLSFTFPVPSTKREIKSAAQPLPPDVDAMRKSPLWTELEPMDAEEARTHVQQDLSWHLSGWKLGPVRVGGVTLVQLVPLLLLFQLWRLNHRCERTVGNYDPFQHPGTDLPLPGTGHPPLDAGLIAGLPALAGLLTAITLWRLSELAWLGILLALATASYAVLTYRTYDRLLGLRSGILRNSIRPPTSLS